MSIEAQPLINTQKISQQSRFADGCQVAAMSFTPLLWNIPSAIIYYGIEDPSFYPASYTFPACGLVHSLAYVFLIPH